MNDWRHIYLYLSISILFDAGNKNEIVSAKLNSFSILLSPVNKSVHTHFKQFHRFVIYIKDTDMILKNSTYK